MNNPYGGNSVTIPTPEHRTDDEARRVALSHNASERVSLKEGQGARQVSIGGPTANPKPAPTSPEPADKATAGTGPGDTIETTHGTAKVHRTMAGQTLVTLPGGVQTTLEEAERAGLIVRDGGGQTQDKPKDSPKSAKDAPKGDGDKAEGAAPGSDQIDPASIDVSDDKAYGAAVNDLGEALSTAGIDEAEGARHIAYAVAEAQNAGADAVELDEGVLSALTEKYGEDGAADMIARGQERVDQVLGAVGAELGLDKLTEEQAARFEEYMAALPRSQIADAAFAAAIGDTSKIRSLLSNFRK